MPEWEQFREAIAAGLPNAERLALLRKLAGWLELAPERAMAALNEEMKSSGPQPLYQTLVILNVTLQCEAGIPMGPESGPELQKLFGEVQQGKGPRQAECAASLALRPWKARAVRAMVLTVLGEAARSWGQGKWVDLKIVPDIWLKNI